MYNNTYIGGQCKNRCAGAYNKSFIIGKINTAPWGRMHVYWLVYGRTVRLTIVLVKLACFQPCWTYVAPIPIFSTCIMKLYSRTICSRNYVQCAGKALQVAGRSHRWTIENSPTWVDPQIYAVYISHGVFRLQFCMNEMLHAYHFHVQTLFLKSACNTSNWRSWRKLRNPQLWYQ